jgi:hypothetical protein
MVEEYAKSLTKEPQCGSVAQHFTDGIEPLQVLRFLPLRFNMIQGQRNDRDENATQNNAAADRHAFNLPARNESTIRGAGCLNWARPDL